MTTERLDEACPYCGWRCVGDECDCSDDCMLMSMKRQRGHTTPTPETPSGSADTPGTVAETPDERACPVCGDDHIWQLHPTCYPASLQAENVELQVILKEASGAIADTLPDHDVEDPAGAIRRLGAENADLRQQRDKAERLWATAERERQRLGAALREIVSWCDSIGDTVLVEQAEGIVEMPLTLDYVIGKPARAALTPTEDER